MYEAPQEVEEVHKAHSSSKPSFQVPQEEVEGNPINIRGGEYHEGVEETAAV